jgi:hypothetical protein
LIDLIVIDQFINGNLILSGIILHSSSQETLSEEKLADPEEGWNTIDDPSLEELKSCFEILNITTKWL